MRLPRALRQWLQRELIKFITEGIEVQICVLPGGRRPKRMSSGAIGYDVFLRRLVSAFDMDPADKRLRKTTFDFEHIPDDPKVARHIFRGEDRALRYRLEPGETVLVDIGIATALPLAQMFEWMTPRSGLASKHRIVIRNAPGTIDADYRGVAGALTLNEGSDPFVLEQGMRIAQIIFQLGIFPEFVEVPTLDDLGGTVRGSGGFGSTGFK